MLAYYGTVVRNLEVLQPFANPYSNLRYPCVYLSTNQALASIYIWNRPYKWMTFEIGADGIPIYTESFLHGLYEFYNGVQGVIYTCEGDFVVDENTAIRHAVVSREPVAISSADMVENAYERILQYERDGLLKINRYKTLSDKQRRRDRNMILNAIRRENLFTGQHPLAGFVMEKFPDIWEEALHQR